MKQVIILCALVNLILVVSCLEPVAPTPVPTAVPTANPRTPADEGYRGFAKSRAEVQDALANAAYIFWSDYDDSQYGFIGDDWGGIRGVTEPVSYLHHDPLVDGGGVEVFLLGPPGQVVAVKLFLFLGDSATNDTSSRVMGILFDTLLPEFPFDVYFAEATEYLTANSLAGDFIAAPDGARVGTFLNEPKAMFGFDIWSFPAEIRAEDYGSPWLFEP